MNKQEAITKVQSSISSIFTKEDVVSIINQIEEGKNSGKPNLDQIKKFLDEAIGNTNFDDFVTIEKDVDDYDNSVSISLSTSVDESDLFRHFSREADDFEWEDEEG
jgi:hypothetical protein